MPRFAKNFIKSALDFLFPRNCLNCRASGHTVCEKCIAGREYATPTQSTFIHPFFSYKDQVVREALWHLKYKGQQDVARVVAREMYERALPVLGELETISYFIKPVLVPIPLSPKDVHNKRLNHAEELARGLNEVSQKSFGGVCTNSLYKNREIRKQMSIKNKSERLENVRGCFSVRDKNKILGKNVIVVDDITTTGATLEEARSVLLDAGAKNVIALVAAH